MCLSLPCLSDVSLFIFDRKMSSTMLSQNDVTAKFSKLLVIYPNVPRSTQIILKDQSKAYLGSAGDLNDYVATLSDLFRQGGRSDLFRQGGGLAELCSAVTVAARRNALIVTHNYRPRTVRPLLFFRAHTTCHSGLAARNSSMAGCSPRAISPAGMPVL